MISAVIDTETTGLVLPSVVELEKQPQIIELGIMLVQGGVAIDQRNWLLDPGIQLTPEQTKHAGGITNEMLAGQPRFIDIVEEFASLMRRAEVAYAHNMPFDHSMIEFELRRCGKECWEEFPWPADLVCTVQEFKHEFGHNPKLVDLYERKIGKPLAQTHRAIEDVQALVEVLLKEGLL